MQKKSEKAKYEKPGLTDLDSFLNKADGVVYCTKLSVHAAQAVHVSQVAHVSLIACPTL